MKKTLFDPDTTLTDPCLMGLGITVPIHFYELELLHVHEDSLECVK